MKAKFLVVLFSVFFTQSWAQVNFIFEDLGKALAEAKTTKKYIMVDVYADWCGWCKKMDVSTFKDSQVSNFVNANMIALKLNSEKGDGIAFAQKHNVTGLPTIVYLDSRGNLVRTAPGYKTATQLMNEIESFKMKQKNTNMLEYLEARKDYIIKLKESILLEGEIGSQLFKSLSFGEENKAFEFEQYKQNFYTQSPVFLSKMDVFYLLGKDKFDQVQSKIKSDSLSNQFSKNQSLYLALRLIENGEKKIEVLQLVNEFSNKTKDVDVLETKVAAQYFLGDLEDAKTTLKVLDKLKKKEKVYSKSYYILKILVYQS